MSSLRVQLEVIRVKRGYLTPEAVVDEAREPTHPLHHRFTWDDAVAGEKYRREQAHRLIQEVMVTYRKSTGKMASVRNYHAVQGPEGTPVYEPLDEIVNNPIARELLLRQMQADWKILKQRYQHVAEFVAMIRSDIAESA